MKTARTLQHFVLKEDSKIYWIENMPERIKLQNGDTYEMYNQALQSAINRAIEVSNPEEVRQHYKSYFLFGHVYSLECSVEKKPDHIRGWTPETGYKNPHYTALVTFPQPEAKTVCGKCKGQGYFSHSNCSACKGSGWIYTQPESMKEDNNYTVREFSMLPLQAGLEVMTHDGIGKYEGITSSGIVTVFINGGMKQYSWSECQPKIMLRHILMMEEFCSKWKDQHSAVNLNIITDEN